MSVHSDLVATRPSCRNIAWLFLALLLLVSSGQAQTIVNLTDQGSAAANGSALQAAIDSAALNTRIILPAGLTYQHATGIVLKYKSTGSGYITIESANLATMPAGERVDPTLDAPNMPKILSPGSGFQAIRTEASATGVHHYKLLGLQIEKGGPTNVNVSEIIAIGTGSSSQNTLPEVPNNIIIDRCYIKGVPPTTQRGIALHGSVVEVRNCYIADIIHDVGVQSAGIGGYNGIGGYIIDNNYIAATGENIIFGGAAVSIPNLVPTGFTITRNHIIKPMTWRHTSDGGANPNGYRIICNLLELKCGRDFLIDGNIFENCWGSPTNHRGTAMAWKLSNWDECNWFVTEDVTFTNNIVRHCSIGIVAQGIDYNPSPGSPYGLVRDFTINNNLFYDISNTYLPSNTGSFLYQTVGGLMNMTLTHNTAFSTSHFIEIESTSIDTTGATISNNVAQNNVRSGAGFGNKPLTDYFPGVIFEKNVLKGALITNYDPELPNYPLSYFGGWSPTSLGFPSSWNGILADQADTTPEPDFASYEVVPTSSYNNAATDGTDVGANIPAIVAATAGCESGVWGGGGSGLIAYDGFNYTGSLNTQNGGTGFGNAWTATGLGNPALSTGSLVYAGGTNELTVGGNKLGPAANCQSTRNFTSAITTANSTKWVSFRVKYTGGGALPSNHLGFTLNPQLAGAGTSIFLGKPGSATNWGADANGSSQQKSGVATQFDVFLLYKLVFTASNVTVSMWVNPSLSAGEGALGPSQLVAPCTAAHSTNILSMKVSTGVNSSAYQLDEFRIGNAFADVTPSTAVDFIVDNNVATLTPSAGDWTVSTFATGQFEGINYLHDGNIKSPVKTCKWTPTIVHTGSYIVYAKWSSTADRTNAAPYTVNHAGGLSAPILRNQQLNGGTWQSLGTFTLNAGTAGYVHVTNSGTTGYLIADAVRFVKQP